MNSTIFNNELSLIQDSVLRQQVMSLIETVDPRHETEPASSTGKYHPDFAHGEGGLVRHTKAVVMIASELCNTRPDLNRDHALAAALLHDMHKYDGPSKYTCHEHPYLMAHDANDARLPADIVKAIESHMGQWTTSSRSSCELPLPETDLQWLIHYADYLASRTWLRLFFDEENNIVTI